MELAERFDAVTKTEYIRAIIQDELIIREIKKEL